MSQPPLTRNHTSGDQYSWSFSDLIQIQHSPALHGRKLVHLLLLAPTLEFRPGAAFFSSKQGANLPAEARRPWSTARSYYFWADPLKTSEADRVVKRAANW
jgi:hypothetical protein